jgi:hypothetical protein
MENFKKRWQIKHHWQLLFPILGVLALLYLAYKLAALILKDFHASIIVLATLALYYLLLKFFLWCFKKLENKWVVTYRWEMIRIFIVFAVTGSTSALVGKPIMNLIGITKENLNPFVYWVLYIIIGLVFYQILLVSLGWLFGQFKFFWEFEKKMLHRFGFKRFLD